MLLLLFLVFLNSYFVAPGGPNIGYPSSNKLHRSNCRDDLLSAVPYSHCDYCPVSSNPSQGGEVALHIIYLQHYVCCNRSTPFLTSFRLCVSSLCFFFFVSLFLSFLFFSFLFFLFSSPLFLSSLFLDFPPPPLFRFLGWFQSASEESFCDWGTMTGPLFSVTIPKTLFVDSRRNSRPSH